MLYQNRWEIALKINDQDFNESPSEFKFVMADSIWNLYSTAKLYFSDKGAFLQELLALSNGNKIEITYGVEEEQITNNYIIKKNGMIKNTTQNSLGGINEVNLIHEYYYGQERISDAFTTPIHTTINNKASSYPFNSIDIDNTKNQGVWYQPLMFDGQFMEEQLLPMAYSTSNKETPYYLFIDSNNDFYFKNYKSLFIDAKPVTSIYTISDTEDSNANNVVKSMNRLQTDISELRRSFNRLLWYFDDQGQYKESFDSILDYPESNNIKVFPIKGDLSLLTNYEDFYSGSIGQDKENEYNNSGLRLFKNRQAFHLEKLFLVMPLNIKFRAGQKLNLIVADAGSDDQNESSLRYSGEYLVETSYHSWNGTTGSTNLVISRQTTNIPDTYFYKAEMIQG